MYPWQRVTVFAERALLLEIGRILFSLMQRIVIFLRRVFLIVSVLTIDACVFGVCRITQCNTTNAHCIELFAIEKQTPAV